MAPNRTWQMAPTSTTTTCRQLGNNTTYDTEKKNLTSHDVADTSAVLGRRVGKTRNHVVKTNCGRHLKRQHFQLSIVRGSPRDFDQRKIEMQTYICSEKGLYVSKGLTLVSEFLRDHTAKSAVKFCNSHHQSQHVRDHLERKLNKLQLNVDVLHINGLLHKMDKFWRIRLFCVKGHIQEDDFRVFVTTNAANVGIDKSHIAL
jgi:hypothetical protein